MTKNKDYNPNEGDLVQQGYEKKEAEINNDVKFKKQENKKIKKNNQEEYDDVLKEIKKKYGTTKVKEEHLIKKHLTKIYPFNCFQCNVIKIQPYDFLTASGIDNGKGKCTSCMADISKRVKKYKESYKNDEEKNVECPCGKCYYATELNTRRHNETLGHINGLAQLKIKGLNKICKIGELRKIASVNKIYDWYNLKAGDIITALLKLPEVIIPEDLK